MGHSHGSSGGFITGNELLAFWIAMSFLGIVVLLSIFAIPRFVGRLWGRTNFRQDLILSKRPFPREADCKTISQASTYATDAPKLTNKDDTPPVSPIYKKGQSSESESVNDSIIQMNFGSSAPLHIPSYSALLHPLSVPFTWSPTCELSGGRILAAIVLLAVIILVTFIEDGDPFSSPRRMGWFATAFLPFTVALGTKNNVIGVLIGVGYEKLNFLHRWLGIASFITANLHMFFFISEWVLTSSTTLPVHMAKKDNIYGLCAIMGLELLYFSSLTFVRDRFYSAFLFSHIVGIVLFFVFLYYHASATYYWIIAGVAIWSFDHALRIFKTRFAVARISTVPSLGFTRMAIPSIQSGWRAGQHVRIRTISSHMGIFGWTVAHPFTVANVPGMCGESGMVLLIKKTGSWTTSLYDCASQADGSVSEQGACEKEIRVIVEGPYSGLGNLVVSSFTSALLVGGGSGITLPLGQAEEIVRDILQGKSSIRFIEVIWITRDEYSIREMIPTFTSILDELSPSSGVSMKVSTYYTAASPISITDRDRLELSLSLPQRLTISPGRPSITAAIDRLARSAASTQSARGVAIGVCGPKELIYDVKQSAHGIDSGLRRSCGGVEIHEEFFGW